MLFKLPPVITALPVLKFVATAVVPTRLVADAVVAKRLVIVPNAVTLGCAAVDSVPVNVAPVLPIVPALTVVAVTVVKRPVL